MDLNFGTESNDKHQSHCGFALVTALSLMAFMLVLVVTLLSLMEVETRSADNNLELQKAREGARLALSMAIDKLQTHAGDDQRVTARAEILGETGGTNNFDDEARYWTGVWDTTSVSADPEWLVSWHEESSDPDPDDVPAESLLMQLVGEGSAGADTEHHVFVPYTNIYDKNGNVTSRIAWWVGDEGVKASAALLPLNKRSNDPGFTPEASMDALHTGLATTQGLETIFANYNRFDGGDAPEIDRVTSVEQLLSQEGFPQNSDPDDTGWDFDYQDGNGNDVTEAAFHTLTSLSQGVLASTESGIGLMEDLSLNPGLFDGELGNYINRGFDSAIAKSSEARGSVAAMRQSVGIHAPNSISSLSNGDIVDLAAPVLTNLMMAFAVYYESATAPFAQVSVSFFSEFWNPYTSTLLMNDGTDDYELELEITGLPSVNIETSSGNTSALIDLKADSILDDPFIVRLKYDSSEAWHPGMTKNWTGISNLVPPFESTNTTTKDLGSSTLDITTTIPNVSIAGDTLGVSSTNLSNTINISIKLVNVNTNSPLTLAEINGIEYDKVDVPVGIAFDDSSNPSFGYQLILKGPRNSNDDTTYNRGVWLFENDPRNPSNKSAYAPTYNGLSAQAFDPLPRPINLNSSTINIERPQRLFDRSEGSDSYYNRLWQESPLFELPRERILSLASLQHLYIHNERPFKVGNSWGDDGVDTLLWFDRYFFSGLSQSDALNSFTQHNGFPNPILTPYNYQGDPTVFDIAPQSVARNALVSGRFNLNSTSVIAWKAVLGGLRINEWPYVDYYPDGNNSNTRTSNNPPEIDSDDRVFNRGNMFTRFPSTLHETYDVFVTPENPDDVAPTEFYRRGVRYLTPLQIEDMAVSIVTQIKAWVQAGNTPFFTVKDFLNDPNPPTGSVLEEAIQASVFTDSASGRQQWDHSWEKDGTGENDASDRIDIDHFSPGFLTQADIMTAIGPMLAPRSDTFRIRARCQTLSPFNSDEVIGDATVEALVQRVPTQLNPADNIDNSIDRKFEIISVRWLTEDEL